MMFHPITLKLAFWFLSSLGVHVAYAEGVVMNTGMPLTCVSFDAVLWTGQGEMRATTEPHRCVNQYGAASLDRWRIAEPEFRIDHGGLTDLDRLVTERSEDDEALRDPRITGTKTNVDTTPL